eukprot:m.202856 g.202856  ORF g.202856 m.202856 type:complete len:106 (+) comp39616_c0_seq12:639-956(+)
MNIRAIVEDCRTFLLRKRLGVEVEEESGPLDLIIININNMINNLLLILTIIVIIIRRSLPTIITIITSKFTAVPVLANHQVPIRLCRGVAAGPPSLGLQRDGRCH